MAINGAELLAALNDIESSKGISKTVILNALKEAMIKGYKKQIGGREDDDNIVVTIDPETGKIDMCQIKKVVKEVEEDDFKEISVEDANREDPTRKYKVGDDFVISATPDDLTKAIAMSVKNILKQKFAEAEKDVLYETFKDKIGTMITGKVEKVDEKTGVSVNIGRTSVYLPSRYMIGDEKFKVGDPIKLFVNKVESGTKTAKIEVSRASEGFLKCLFTEEIHEIYDGTIVIRSIAREAGERSKVAVSTEDPNMDPAGACIGPNGSRIQKIVGQLGNGQVKEKIDIITYSNVPGLYIMEALKPAKVIGIYVDEENKTSIAIVKDDSFSTAIGRKGVNVRLASKLTNYKVDVKTETQAAEEGLEYQTFDELKQIEDEQKAQAAYEKRAIEVQNQQKEIGLPGLPEGYVAPQQRVYQEENNTELQEALEQASEKEETVLPQEEVKVVEQPVAKEEKVEAVPAEEKKEVKTTTSLEDLEKSLSEESNKQANKNSRRNNKKKKDDSEDQNTKGALDTSGAERMSIYTEEELREMEEEEREEEDSYDDDVDYDEYDDYYDDDDR